MTEQDGVIDAEILRASAPEPVLGEPTDVTRNSRSE